MQNNTLRSYLSVPIPVNVDLKIFKMNETKYKSNSCHKLPFFSIELCNFLCFDEVGRSCKKETEVLIV